MSLKELLFKKGELYRFTCFSRLPVVIQWIDDNGEILRTKTYHYPGPDPDTIVNIVKDDGTEEKIAEIQPFDLNEIHKITDDHE